MFLVRRDHRSWLPVPGRIAERIPVTLPRPRDGPQPRQRGVRENEKPAGPAATQKNHGKRRRALRPSPRQKPGSQTDPHPAKKEKTKCHKNTGDVVPRQAGSPARREHRRSRAAPRPGPGRLRHPVGATPHRARGHRRRFLVGKQRRSTPSRSACCAPPPEHWRSSRTRTAGSRMPASRSRLDQLRRGRRTGHHPGHGRRRTRHRPAEPRDRGARPQQEQLRRADHRRPGSNPVLALPLLSQAFDIASVKDLKGKRVSTPPNGGQYFLLSLRILKGERHDVRRHRLPPAAGRRRPGGVRLRSASTPS